jgi:hypothetical protein
MQDQVTAGNAADATGLPVEFNASTAFRWYRVMASDPIKSARRVAHNASAPTLLNPSLGVP